MGGCAEGTRKKVGGIQMDLQGEACSRRKRGEAQGIDINFVVNSLSQFMVDPRRVHWTAAKHILRYIKATVEYGLVYERRGSVQLAGFTDVDWAGCVEDRKSTSG